MALSVENHLIQYLAGQERHLWLNTKLVLEQSTTNGAVVQMSSRPAGIYEVQVTGDSGRIYLGRLTKL